MKPTPEQLQTIDTALEKGNKIEAIKLYRLASGLDLKDSKEAVESRLHELQRIHPARFPQSKSGCLSVLLLAGLPVAGLILIVAT